MHNPYSLVACEADYDLVDLAAWEAAEREKDIQRVYKTEKRFRDPRAEKQLDFRHPAVSSCRSRLREDKKTKKRTVRSYRRFLKRNITNELYYRSLNRDYRTDGWICW